MKYKDKNIYTYCEIIKNTTNYYYEKYCMEQYITQNNIDKNFLSIIYKEKLFNLVMNICNQYVYNYVYKFTEDDFNFMSQFKLADKIDVIIKSLQRFLINYKKQVEKI